MKTETVPPSVSRGESGVVCVAYKGRGCVTSEPAAMKRVSVVVVAAAVLVSLAAAQLQSTFGNDKSLQRYLGNPELVQKQIKCVLEDKDCDELGHKLKGNRTFTITNVYNLLNYGGLQ